MNVITKWKIKGIVFALVAVLAAATFSRVSALIPSSDGTISGCYKNSRGFLRVIDAEAGESCRRNETALSWSSAGGGSQGTLLTARPYIYFGTTNVPVMTIPGFGELTGGCSGTASEEGIFYHNTTSDIVSVYGKNSDVLPGETIQFDLNLQPKTVLLAINTATQSGEDVVELNIAGHFTNSNPFICKYAVTALFP